LLLLLLLLVVVVVVAAGGVTSGGEDDPEGDYFDKDINPHDLLKDMAQPAPGDNSSLQPYQILRAIRGSKNRSRRSGVRAALDSMVEQFVHCHFICTAWLLKVVQKMCCQQISASRWRQSCAMLLLLLVVPHIIAAAAVDRAVGCVMAERDWQWHLMVMTTKMMMMRGRSRVMGALPQIMCSSSQQQQPTAVG
jgi:hypothetical protein